MTFSDIVEIIVDKAVTKGVVYLMDAMSEPIEEAPCLHCSEDTAYTICGFCRRQLGIDHWGILRSEMKSIYSLLQGHEVEVCTGKVADDYAVPTT